MLAIKTTFLGFKGPAGIGSLLILFPLYLLLISVGDSLSSNAEIRLWNKHRGGFDLIKKDQQPFQYWLGIFVSWLGVAMLGWFFFTL